MKLQIVFFKFHLIESRTYHHFLRLSVHDTKLKEFIRRNSLSGAIKLWIGNIHGRDLGPCVKSC